MAEEKQNKFKKEMVIKMSKYAVISDIHGNISALKAVLADAEKLGCKHYIFLGDYIFDMPFSNDVIACVSEISGAVFIAGNKERYLDWLSLEDQSQWTAEQMGAIYQTYRELTPHSRKFIARLQDTEYIPLVGGGNIFACHCFYDLPYDIMSDYGCDGGLYEKMTAEHWSRDDFNNYFCNMIGQKGFKDITQNIDASVVLMGHNHIQGHGYAGSKLMINPGSCGIPLDLDPRAAYTVLEETHSRFNVIERRVEYDIESLVAACRKTEVYRNAEFWCEILFKTLKTGVDHNKMMLKAAQRIANKKGEHGRYFSNETWREAYSAFIV